MKVIIGLLLMLSGIIIGLYVGLWWAFIGGIIQIIEQIRAENLDVTIVAWGIVKVFFAGTLGWFTGVLFFVAGSMFMKD